MAQAGARNRFDRLWAKVSLAAGATVLGLVAAWWGLRANPERREGVERAVRLWQLPDKTPPFDIQLTNVVSIDPREGLRYPPCGWTRTYYPTNPRGYLSPQRRGVLPALLWLHPTVDPPARARWESQLDDGREIAHLRIEHIDPAQPWLVRLFNTNISPQAGEPLEFSLRLRADRAWTVDLSWSTTNSIGPPEPVHHLIEVGTRWQTYRWTIPDDSTAGPRHLSCNLGNQTGELWLADAQLAGAKADKRPLPGGRLGRFFVDYHTNSQGFREREFSPEPPPSTMRIACLGDSFTWGTGLREEDAWPRWLERELNGEDPASGSAATPIRYEVLNCAIAMTSTLEQRRLYESQVAAWGAQLVILGMCYNDNLTCTDVEAIRVALESQGRAGEQGPQSQALSERRGYRACVDEITRLKAACAAHQARLAVVILANGYHHLWARMTDEVTPACQALGIPWLSTRPALEEAGLFGAPSEVHPADAHPNELATPVMARAIAAFLRREGLLTAAPGTGGPANGPSAAAPSGARPTP